MSPTYNGSSVLQHFEHVCLAGSGRNASTSAENERGAKSSTETSRSTRACANKCKELGMEGVEQILEFTSPKLNQVLMATDSDR